jgi:hypothetical protein
MIMAARATAAPVVRRLTLRSRPRFTDALHVVWRVHGLPELGAERMFLRPPATTQQQQRTSGADDAAAAAAFMRSPDFSLAGRDGWHLRLYMGGDAAAAAAEAEATEKRNAAAVAMAAASAASARSAPSRIIMPADDAPRRGAACLHLCCAAPVGVPLPAVEGELLLQAAGNYRQSTHTWDYDRDDDYARQPGVYGAGFAPELAWPHTDDDTLLFQDALQPRDGGGGGGDEAIEAEERVGGKVVRVVLRGVLPHYELSSRTKHLLDDDGAVTLRVTLRAGLTFETAEEKEQPRKA